MRNRPFEFNILVVYLKWTKIVEVDENCRFIIKFLKEVNDLWRKKFFKLFNKGTNCLLSIENKYQNIVLRFIHLWRHIRKPVKWTKTADVALYAHKRTYTYSHIYEGGMRENIYIYIGWFITNLQETPWVDAKRNKVLLVSSAHRPCWCGRNIVWNMERDQSFWITSSEHQGTMPKRIFSFSCSMQVIQFADLQFHLIK